MAVDLQLSRCIRLDRLVIGGEIEFQPFWHIVFDHEAGLADRRPLLGKSFTDEVTDHDKSRGDADAHLQGTTGGGLDPRHRLEQ